MKILTSRNGKKQNKCKKKHMMSLVLMKIDSVRK